MANWKYVNKCKFYLLALPTTYTGWSDVTFSTAYANVNSLAVDQSIATETINIRNDAGYDITILGNKAGKISFNVVDDGGDLITLLSDTYQAKKTILAYVADGDIATTGTKGLRSPFVITNFSPDQSGSVVTYKVEMAVTYDAALEPEWYVVSGS